jgi:hypothetical protein
VRDGVVDTRVIDGLTLITLAGELDLSVAPTVRRALVKAPAAGFAGPCHRPASGRVHGLFHHRRPHAGPQHGDGRGRVPAADRSATGTGEVAGSVPTRWCAVYL